MIITMTTCTCTYMSIVLVLGSYVSQDLKYSKRPLSYRSILWLIDKEGIIEKSTNSIENSLAKSLMLVSKGLLYTLVISVRAFKKNKNLRDRRLNEGDECRG